MARKPYPTPSRLRILANTILVKAFQIVDVVFWFWKPGTKNPPKDTYDESDSWDDEEFIGRIHSRRPPYLPGSDKSIVEVSENRVLKSCLDITEARSEALAMEYVRAQTSIPVPRVRRVASDDDWRDFIVMDYIPNARQLHGCWPSLSIWTRFKVILTMRYYLRQLRRIQVANPTKPGPLGPKPCACQGLQFIYQSSRPLPDVAALMKYFNKFLKEVEYIASRGQGPPPNAQPLEESAFTPLVFTHNDLNMRNILLDDTGRLWIVDWNFSGLFPRWFEYTAMRFAALKDREPYSWKTVIKFMAEPSFSIETWFTKIGKAHYPGL